VTGRVAFGSSLLLLGACAFEAGSGFATLEAGELHAALEVDAVRDLGDGVLLTDRGYRVRIEALTLQAEEFALSQADVDAERFAEVAHAPIGLELDLLAGDEVTLGPFEPSAELGAGTIDRAELHVEQLVVSAVIDGGELQAPRAVTATVDLHEPLVAPVALQLDRDVPERLTPEAQLHADATLFDGVDFDALEESALERILAARLREWVARSELTVDLGIGQGQGHGQGQGREEGHGH
jgi:hypothetical protein